MARETFEQLRGVGQLAAACRALERGDIDGAVAACDSLEPARAETPAWRKLRARSLFHAGRAEESHAELVLYLDSRPDDFDALLLAYRILHIRNQRSGPGRLADLPERLTALMVRELEHRAVRRDGDWLLVCMDVVTDDRLAGALAGIGLEPAVCQGTYFLFVDARRFLKPGEDDEGFCRRLVIEAGVAAVPVSAFYLDRATAPTDFIRFCFAKRDEVLDGAVERLAGYLG